MEKLIEQFQKLCNAFRNYSRKEYGWDSQNFCDNNVRCYFSSSGAAHSTVRIEGIEVAFFEIPTIHGRITLLTESNLQRLIDKYSVELDIMKKRDAEGDSEKKKKEKADKAENLRRQLKELEESENNS